MRRNGSHNIGALLVFLMAVCTQLALAEVYKWVDADGDIHFGDKPRDAALAEQAESVDIVESYQPDTRTAQDQEAFDREQQAIRRKTELFKSEDEERRKAKQDNHKDQKAKRCASMAADIKKFTTMHRVDEVRTYYYLTGDDGKSVSSSQQKEIIEGLRNRYAAAGCN
jgi:hypothetical protein